MICSPGRSGLFCGGLFVRAQIENAAEYRRADDDRIADKAQRVRDLAEDEKAPERRIDDLRIVKHGDLLRRGVAVRGGNGKLPSGRGAAGQQQKDPLLRAHRLEVESEERDGADAGERGEKHHDLRPALALAAHLPDERVRGACAETAQHAGERGKTRNARRGTDDEYRADKRRQNAENVHLLRVLAQNEYGKEDGEKRRELVEHIGVGHADVIDGPEIGDHAEHTGDAPCQMAAETALMDAEALPLAREDHECGDRRHQIPEEDLLHRGNVSGEPDKKATSVKNRMPRIECTECRACARSSAGGCSMVSTPLSL